MESSGVEGQHQRRKKTLRREEIQWVTIEEEQGRGRQRYRTRKRSKMPEKKH